MDDYKLILIMITLQCPISRAYLGKTCPIVLFLAVVFGCRPKLAISEITHTSSIYADLKQHKPGSSDQRVQTTPLSPPSSEIHRDR